MNKFIFTCVAALACVAVAYPQHSRPAAKPKPRATTRRKVLDLRTHKATSGTSPFIASPIYIPQTAPVATAITASDGFLYVVSGDRLYKISQKSLKTIQVATLGRQPIEPVSRSRAVPKARKVAVERSSKRDRSAKP